MSLSKKGVHVSELIDTHAIKSSHKASWYAEELAEVSGVHLRFRVMRDTSAEFHRHVEGPECFFVLSGEVQLDTEHGSVTLLPRQFFKVGASVSHRTRVKGEATLLVVDRLES